MKSLAKFFNHNFDDGEFRLYNKNNKLIYHEDSYGFWFKREYDKNNNIIYSEDSSGCVKDYRPKCNGKVVVIDGIEYELGKAVKPRWDLRSLLAEPDVLYTCATVYAYDIKLCEEDKRSVVADGVKITLPYEILGINEVK